MRPRMLSALRVIAACASVAMVSACDPCVSAFGCRQSPHATLVGQVVDPVSGRPVGDVDLSLKFVSGVALESATANTRSGSNGSFEFSISAASVGEVRTDI